MPHGRPPSGAPRRVMLKLSGELLSGSQGTPFAQDGLALVADQVTAAAGSGAQIGVVLGGGNLLRGSRSLGQSFPRVDADEIGMVGTLINALVLRAELTVREIPSRVLCSFDVPRAAELHTPRRARQAFAAGEVVIFAGGTGNPYFTTDTAAALRALETGCDLLIKATLADGVYTADPNTDPDARLFSRVTYEEVLARKLAVMDLTAVTLCMENRLPIVVLNARDRGSVKRFLEGETLGTLVVPDDAPAGFSDQGAGAKRGGRP